MSISNPKSLTTMCLSKPKSALSTQSANVRKTNTLYNNQRYWNRRCQTAVSKPHRHDRRMVEACSYHVVRQMDLEGHKAALNNAVMVLGIHRSKSEVDVHSVQSDVSHTSSHYMPRENSQILLSANNSEILRERRTAGLNREETRIPTTKLPKKGLIKLTSLDYEMQDPTYYDKYKDDLDEDSWIRKKPLGHISEPHKPLVKKTMIEHMKEGKRMLEEQEKLHHEQEEIEKQLGEYTIADLHKNLEDVTTELVKKKSEEIVKSVAKPFNKHVTQRKQRQQPVERSVTLPSIKDFSFG
ncbi:Hypothetical predicted protein [Mytilus galloprovincialis]|nr:Hypothetical predicted protein [Mytilus galloprovincialis]